MIPKPSTACYFNIHTPTIWFDLYRKWGRQYRSGTKAEDIYCYLLLFATCINIIRSTKHSMVVSLFTVAGQTRKVKYDYGLVAGAHFWACVIVQRSILHLHCIHQVHSPAKHWTEPYLAEHCPLSSVSNRQCSAVCAVHSLACWLSQRAHAHRSTNGYQQRALSTQLFVFIPMHKYRNIHCI